MESLRSWLRMSCLLPLLLPLLAAPHAWADSVYAPVMCKGDNAYLIATSHNAEPEPFWFQNLGSQPFVEKQGQVAGQHAEIYSLSEQMPWGLGAVALKTRPGSEWEFQTFCKDTRTARSIASNASPWKTFRPKSSELGKDRAVWLSFVNLSQQNVTVQIEFLGVTTALTSRQKVILATQKFTAGPEFSRQQFSLAVPAKTRSFQIKSEGRWVGIAMNSAGKEIAVADDVVMLEKVPSARYFLMSPQSGPKSESFVVPLTDSKMIAETLEQIANPMKAQLLVAAIEKGLHGPNRDFKSLAKSPWSWQVSQAINYADFASIGCDGSPSAVEERVDDWIRNTNGTICFWNYRVERELTAQEVEQSRTGEELSKNGATELSPLFSRLVPGSLRQKL